MFVLCNRHSSTLKCGTFNRPFVTWNVKQKKNQVPSIAYLAILASGVSAGNSGGEMVWVRIVRYTEFSIKLLFTSQFKYSVKTIKNVHKLLTKSQ